MTEETIARDFPGLPKKLQPVALLLELLDTAAALDASDAQGDRLDPQEEKELADTRQLAAVTIRQTLARIDEQTLREAGAYGLLSADDLRAALTLHRRLQLVRGRTFDREIEQGLGN